MKLEQIKGRLVTDYESKAWRNLERTYDALIKEGCEPTHIQGICMAQDDESVKVGDRYINLCTVYRNNATDENVSADIEVMEVIGKTTCSYSIRRIFKARISGDPSDKVIANRVKKALDALKK